MDNLMRIELLLLAAFSVWVYRELISTFLIKKQSGGIVNLLRHIPWVLYFIYNIYALFGFWRGVTLIPYVLVCMLCYCLISAVYYEVKNIGLMLFINAVFAVCWMSVVIILVYIFQGLGIETENNEHFQRWYIICVMSQFIMLAIIKLIQLKAKANDEFHMSLGHFITSLATTAGSIFVVYTIYFLLPSIDSNAILVMSIISTFLIIGINLMNYYSFQNYSDSLNIGKNNLLYQRQVSDYMFQCENQEYMLKQINEINHDTKNHLIAIRELAKGQETSRLCEYVDELLKSGVGNRIELVKTGNYIVDALINEKYSRAVRAGTDFQVEAFIPKDLPFSDGDLALILGNALDNAVEAVETAPEKKITVSLVYSKMVFRIEICNTYDGRVSLNNKKEIRTKKKQAELHGVGLPTIRHAVEKYDGELSIDYDDKFFKLVAMLYAPID